MNESEIDGGVRVKKNPFLFFKNKYQFLYHSVPTKKGGIKTKKYYRNFIIITKQQCPLIAMQNFLLLFRI